MIAVTVAPTTPAATFSPTPAPTATLSQPIDPIAVIKDQSVLITPAATATLTPLGVFNPCPVQDSVAPPVGSLSILYFNDSGLWRWEEETDTRTALPLPPDAASPLPSPDAERVAFTLERDDGVVELWVIDRDGGNQQRLATVSIADYLAASPEYVADATLTYRWIAERNLLAYELTPVLQALGDIPRETVTIADPAIGETWTLVPGGEVGPLIYRADGLQAAGFTEESVRLIDVNSGTVQHVVSLPLYNWNRHSADYTPGGEKLVAFTEEGIGLVDTATGAAGSIPFSYTPIGMGHYALMPPIYWLPDGFTFYTLTPEGNDEGDIFAPDDRFTIWRVDTRSATVEAVETYTGSMVSVRFSPDMQRLSFWTQRPDNVRTLYVADLELGEQVAYDRLPSLEFLDWHPDSKQFIYWEFREKAPLLGHLCRPATPLEGVTIPLVGTLHWIDADRFIAVEGMRRGFEVEGPWEIHLRSVTGEDLLLDTVEGKAPQVGLIEN